MTADVPLSSVHRGDDGVGLDDRAALGRLRLRHQETNEIILIPAPSQDPNDPLNWSKARRIYSACLVCAAVCFCNFLAAGPTVAIVEIVIDFSGYTPKDPQFPAAISKIAYFFTTTALLQGMGNLFWMPLIIKYGRRPVYITAFTCYLVTAIWAGVSKSYASELASRILMGFFSGAGECIGPLSISDLFFLHERGLYMAAYTAFLSAGVSFGIIVDGLITINLSWRYIYYVAVALIGALTLLVVFTLPETAYNRTEMDSGRFDHAPPETVESGSTSDVVIEKGNVHHRGNVATGRVPAKKSFIRGLSFFNGSYTEEPLLRMAIRPVILLALPPILWATLVMSVTIGFLVAISSNFASAFSSTYNFTSWQSGLCFISGMIGTLLGIFGGGWFSDWVADYFTKRAGGIREPEMRLPAMTVSMITSPLALVLYGCGIQYHWHWIAPTLGLGLLSFSIAQGTNVSLVYIIDAYRPIAGETVVTQLAFKSAFGFLLSFYTNPWIAKSGYAASFGTMAAISFAVIALWVPMYIWGRTIRHTTLSWGFISRYIKWDVDREVGE
ncbi:MFS transporter [Myriangium duriaei CBS 260.36]|uniref:MFS transporter n=1 Tax=Myriangium duriaei CBS 260.36 TaxID=1168546 RepID=A0A9P4MQF7_9PEZI|nr:MFS transporter [Myriangium duriaei CBS 260.36]